MNTTEIVDRIREILIERKQTLSVAESVTSGLFQTVIASTEKASHFFQGGITAYNLGQKCRHLSIDPIHGMECNCVSEKVAEEMSVNVSKMFTSDWGISTTGYATAVPESDNQLYAFSAITFKGKVMHCQKIETDLQDPHDVQRFYVDTIMEALLDAVNQAEEVKGAHAHA